MKTCKTQVIQLKTWMTKMWLKQFITQCYELFLFFCKAKQQFIKGKNSVRQNYILTNINILASVCRLDWLDTFYTGPHGLCTVKDKSYLKKMTCVRLWFKKQSQFYKNVTFKKKPWTLHPWTNTTYMCCCCWTAKPYSPLPILECC